MNIFKGIKPLKTYDIMRVRQSGTSMDNVVLDDGDLSNNVWTHEWRLYWEPVGSKKREITRQIEYKYSNRR